MQEEEVAAAPSSAVVRNDATGKKYKVAVRKAILVDGGHVAQDITVLTLKKNFSAVISAPSHQNVVVRWERNTAAFGHGELLSDAELIPLGGTLVLEILLTPPPPRQSHSHDHSPSLMSAAKPPLVRNPSHDVNGKAVQQQQLQTPQRRELLELAKHIFHGDSSLAFHDKSPQASTTPSQGHSPDDGYRTVAESVRPDRRGSPSVRRSVSAARHEDPSMQLAEQSIWMDRCLLLERQKDSLEKKLMDMQREISVAQERQAANTSPALAARPLEAPKAQATVATEPNAVVTVQPSKALRDELEALQRRRHMLQEVRSAKLDEWTHQKHQLQSSIQSKKESTLHALQASCSNRQSTLRRLVGEMHNETSNLHTLQRELDATDALADTEKARVDEATRRLDRCKERMIAMLSQLPPSQQGEYEEAVKRKDAELAQFIASTAAQKHKHLVALDQRATRTKNLRGTYEDTLQQRVRLHHSVEDAKGNIRVLVRMRPVVPNDAAQPQHIKHLEDGALEVDEGRNAVFLSTPTTGMKRFEFYSVYGPAEDSVAQQGVIFEEQVKPLLKSVIDGTNVAVMAYGPTGSGKTFTILGKTESGQLSGLLPQSMEFLLDTLMVQTAPATPATPTSSTSERLQCVESCTMTMVEVYMDQVYDILGQLHGVSESAAKVDVRQASDTVSLSGVTEVPVTKWDDAVTYLQEGLRVRKTHRTLKNLESSRSHLIVSLHLVIQGGSAKEGVYRSKLVFVDLAGSERVSKSLSQGERLKEAQHINKSLSALGDVVHALSSTPRPAYIPYRNSRLTQLLFDAVGGNAKTLLITCICPHLPQQHNMSETQSTLQFASRAKNVRNALVQRSTGTPNTSIDSSR